MTEIVSYVCEDCHAGWQVRHPDDPTVCRFCGQPGKIRGRYRAEPLEEDEP